MFLIKNPNSDSKFHIELAKIYNHFFLWFVYIFLKQSQMCWVSATVYIQWVWLGFVWWTVQIQGTIILLYK